MVAKRPSKIKKSVSARTPVGGREKILRVATRLFADKGFDSVSVRMIAEQSRMNLSLISYYFGGKEKLYMIIVEEHALRMKSTWEEIIARSGSRPFSEETFSEYIHGVVRNLVVMRIKSPEIWRLIQRERIDGLPHARRVFEETMAPLSERLVAVVEQARSLGFIRGEVNSRVFFSCLFEVVMGYFTAHDCHLKSWKETYRFPKDQEKFIEWISGLFTRGVFR